MHRWKLHLRPKDLTSSHIKDGDILPLPEGLCAVKVLSDFLKYLFDCARIYIVETHSSGASLWKSSNRIEFLLTYPNVWEGAQKYQIRKAAELAGLIPSGEQSRLHLLTEGEAMLHFCLTALFESDALGGQPILYSNDFQDATGDQGAAIIDAGDGAVNISVYSVFSPSAVVKDIAPGECKHLHNFHQNAKI